MSVDIVEGLCSLAWFTGACQGMALGAALVWWVRSSPPKSELPSRGEPADRAATTQRQRRGAL